MKPWHERPTEIANLFNPAFCALIVRDGSQGFAEHNPTGMPYPLAFVLLPIVLHRGTRNILPKTIATKLHPWIEQHRSQDWIPAALRRNEHIHAGSDHFCRERRSHQHFDIWNHPGATPKAEAGRMA